MHEPPYYENYSKIRLFIHNVVTSKYFDLAIAAVIGLNVVTMALEFYMMPKALTYALKIFNYFFTAVFILESLMKLLALGLPLYLKDKYVYMYIYTKRRLCHLTRRLLLCSPRGFVCILCRCMCVFMCLQMESVGHRYCHTLGRGHCTRRGRV